MAVICSTIGIGEVNVAAGVTADRVNELYRRAVFKVHPDHGGSAEAFRRVQEAKQLLDKYLAV